MESQKMENLLNLAIDATETEREKSLELDVGYNPIDREWDLIIKYSGDLGPVRELARQVTELLNEYAVLTIEESRIEQLAALPQVEYIEKPKRLFFETAAGRRVSCIDAVQDTRFSLFGQGTLIAVIDSGIDYANEDFRNEDGTTRILALWDQTVSLADTLGPPQGYFQGTEYLKEKIDEALAEPTEPLRRAIVPSMDTSGHGTAVAGIAAGNGRNGRGGGNEGNYAGVAPQSELLIVKLGSPRQDGFPRTTELIQGVDYVVRKSMEYNLPMAVNISFGYPSVTALILWTRKYQKCPLNINLQFFHSILLYL